MVGWVESCKASFRLQDNFDVQGFLLLVVFFARVISMNPAGSFREGKSFKCGDCFWVKHIQIEFQQERFGIFSSSTCNMSFDRQKGAAKRQYFQSSQCKSRYCICCEISQGRIAVCYFYSVDHSNHVPSHAFLGTRKHMLKYIDSVTVQ